MYVGTPCQVAAINNIYTHLNKDTAKIITCDLICHGVPSYKMFDGYLNMVLNKKTKLQNISFRNKKYGWQDFSMQVITTDGGNLISRSNKDKFLKTFLSDICLRSSCYECKFSQIPRVGDISLGDFWGVPDNIKNDYGTSAILANSRKGIKLIKSLSIDNKIDIKNASLKTISLYNRRVTGGNMLLPKTRNIYLNKLKNDNFLKLYWLLVFPLIVKKSLAGWIFSKNKIKNLLSKFIKN